MSGRRPRRFRDHRGSRPLVADAGRWDTARRAGRGAGLGCGLDSDLAATTTTAREPARDAGAAMALVPTGFLPPDRFTGFALADVLDAAQCDALISALASAGFAPAGAYPRDYRNNDRAGALIATGYNGVVWKDSATDG
jgi:hypothetical protein